MIRDMTNIGAGAETHDRQAAAWEINHRPVLYTAQVKYKGERGLTLKEIVSSLNS